MRHLVASQTIEVIGSKPVAITHFNTVWPALWECSKELVEIGNKIAPVFVIGRPKPAEFKHQQADGVGHCLAGLEKCFIEQLGIQEILVWFAGLVAEWIQLGKFFDSNRVCHFEAEQKVILGLIYHAFKVLLAGKVVIRGIDANGLEHLGIFAQARNKFSKFKSARLESKWISVKGL